MNAPQLENGASGQFRLQSRGGGWAVVGVKTNTLAFYSKCYPKAAGVLEFLNEWKIRKNEPSDVC